MFWLTLLISLATAATSAGVNAKAALPLLRPLAHPPVSGAAGPFPKVTVTLRRTNTVPHAPFDGEMRLMDGRSLPLAGPDLPADFFRIDVTAVVFTPIGRTRTNGLVILYDSSQIGPQHGTDHLALVYRVTRSAAVRVAAAENRLEGVGNAAAARRRLTDVRP